MQNAEQILVVGAGAAGLLGANILSQHGYHVTVLEALDRIGGRMHTYNDACFATPIELGAEFIHGKLPITLGLLDEAKLPYHAVDGEWWQVVDGNWRQNHEGIEHWDLLMEKLNDLHEDCSIGEFLARAFGGPRYEKMRAAVIGYVQGLDAADERNASAFGLREEWSMADERQYRIHGGYGMLANYLREKSEAAGATFHLSTEIIHLSWEPGKVAVRARDGREFVGQKILITLPIGLLQQETLQCSPVLPNLKNAAADIGNGNVIKFLLQFKDAFWESSNLGSMSHLSMLFSDQEIPTWWTQYPERASILVGWVGGPQALALSGLSKTELLEKAILSLHILLNDSVEHVRANLEAVEICDWTALPFTRGAYSYEKVNSPEARKILNTPIADTIFFAGEALCNGTAKGTVEAALSSGRQAAASIMRAG